MLSHSKTCWLWQDDIFLDTTTSLSKLMHYNRLLHLLRSLFKFIYGHYPIPEFVMIHWWVLTVCRCFWVSMLHLPQRLLHVSPAKKIRCPTATSTEWKKVDGPAWLLQFAEQLVLKASYLWCLSGIFLAIGEEGWSRSLMKDFPSLLLVDSS